TVDQHLLSISLAEGTGSSWCNRRGNHRAVRPHSAAPWHWGIPSEEKRAGQRCRLGVVASDYRRTRPTLSMPHEDERIQKSRGIAYAHRDCVNESRYKDNSTGWIVIFQGKANCLQEPMFF